MRATKYFKNGTDMTDFADQWKAKAKDNWYLRTFLRCDHVLNEQRKSIILVDNERLIQRLILCRICNVHGNSPEVNAIVETLKTATL